MTKKIKPQILRVLQDEYGTIKATNYSLLKRVHESPAVARWWMDNPQEPTPAMFLGSALHCSVLEPRALKERYATWTGGRRSGKEWEQFRLAYSTRQILTADQAQHVAAMTKAIKTHPIAGPLFRGKKQTELTLVWVHPRTGATIKSRIDLLRSDLWLDVKTCSSLARFQADFARFGYAMQFALYGDGLAACGKGALPAKCVAIETSPPHQVAVYDITEADVMSYGRDQYEAALDTYLECMRNGNWPGKYDHEEITLRLPGWALPQDDLDLDYTGLEQKGSDNAE